MTVFPTQMPSKPTLHNKHVAHLLAIVGPSLSVGCALLLWLFSLQSVDVSQMSDIGLVSVLPAATFAAFGLLMVSFAIAVHQKQTPRWLLLLHVVALIVMIHGTPAILYGTLRYSWAWKHVGIVDYIQRHGTVNPDIAVLDAYHNWPGFFALNALITELAGLENPLPFAPWAPMFFNLLNIGTLWMIYRSFTRDERLIWLGIWLFFLSNWVGQDYFSPQTMTYFLHLLMLGICLRWFSITTLPTKPAIKHWLRVDWLVSLYYKMVTRATPVETIDSALQPTERTKWLTMLILISGVIASSHQLSPFMTIASLVLLILFLRCNARTLPLVMFILTMSWFTHGAQPFVNKELGDVIKSIGQVSTNVDSNFIELSQASFGQQIVAITGRALSLFVWLLAFLGAIRRWRNGFRDLTPALLLLAPFVMLVGDSYGGEILFRVYLFTLPFTIFFAAALLYPSANAGKSGWNVMMTFLLSVILLAGFLLAHFGKDQQYYFSPKEVEVAEYLYHIAPPNSLLVEGARSYPTQFHNYEFYTYVPIAREPVESRLNVLNNPTDVLARWMDNEQYAASYLIITRSQKAAVDMVGTMPVGSLDKIEQALIVSPNFHLLYGNEDAKIFVLSKDVNGANP